MSLKQLCLEDFQVWGKPLRCRFLGLRAAQDGDGAPWVELEDGSGRLSLELADRAFAHAPLAACTSVEVTFVPAFDDRPLGLMVASLVPLRAATASEAVRRLELPEMTPRDQEALVVLQALATALDADPLGGFMARLLSEPRIREGFAKVPASHNHHHAYAGGLLVHTAEMLGLVAEMAQRKLSHQPRRVWQCQVGALLHDLGKVVTHGPAAMNLRARPSHEYWSVVLAARSLDWLALHDADSAQELHAVLQAGVVKGDRPHREASVVVELVRLADQCSAMHLGEWNRRAVYGPVAANDGPLRPGQKTALLRDAGRPHSAAGSGR